MIELKLSTIKAVGTWEKKSDTGNKLIWEDAKTRFLVCQRLWHKFGES